MIKVIIFDGDGTLQFPNPSEEMRNFIALLPELGITMAIASNGSRRQIINNFEAADLDVPDIIVTPADLGTTSAGRLIKKPSPDFVYRIRKLTQVELNEIMYVGDDDNTDAFCAINAGVLPLAAKYSTANTPRNYGFQITTPSNLEGYIKRFAKQKEPYFGWSFQNPELGVDTRAVFGDQGSLKESLRSILKEEKDQNIGKNQISARVLLFMSFMTQLYLSGISTQIDVVAVYPGHMTGKFNKTLSVFLDYTAKLFNDKFYRDLLVRHIDAPKSQHQGAARNIFDQFRTIHVNENYRRKIQGKTILILDDFTTAGYSLETARHMLLKAGASKVIGLAIAKFRRTHAVAEIKETWDPYQPFSLKQSDIKLTDYPGVSNSNSDNHFFHHIWNHYNR